MTDRLAVTDEEAGERLDLFVARRLAVSRTQAATLVANAHVAVDGRREKASWRLRAGEIVAVDVPPPVGREVIGEDIPLSIVYEDDDLVVIDKPAGMVVHPAPGNWTGTLVNALVGRGQSRDAGGDDDRPGLVHRIDKDTSGLLVGREKRARAPHPFGGDRRAPGVTPVRGGMLGPRQHRAVHGREARRA